MRKVLDEADKPKKGGKKKGVKVGLSEPDAKPSKPPQAPKRKWVNKMTCKIRSPKTE